MFEYVGLRKFRLFQTYIVYSSDLNFDLVDNFMSILIKYVSLSLFAFFFFL